VIDILPNLILTLILLAAFGVLFWFGSKKMGVSRLPVALIAPPLLIAGLVLHLPAGPLHLPSDGQFYLAWGYAISDSWAGVASQVPDGPLWPGKGFWPLIIALFHSIVGPVAISLIVFNTMVFGATVLALQKSVLLLTGKNTRWSMVIVVLSSTPFILFGPSLLRESLFWLGISGGVLALSYLRSKKIGLALASVSWGSFLLLAVRPDAGVVLVYAFLGVTTVLVGLLGSTRSAPRRIIAVATLGALAVSAPQAFDFVRPGTDAGFVDYVSGALSKQRVETGFSSRPEPKALSSDGTSIGILADVQMDDFSSGLETNLSNSKAEIVRGSILDLKELEKASSDDTCEKTLAVKIACEGLENLPRALAGPFYWEYGPESIWIISGLSTLHFLALAGLSVVYLVTRGGRNWVTAGMMGVATISLVMFAAILTNYGLLIRLRAATEIVLLPLAIGGYFAVVAKWKALKVEGWKP
jgi:hypothetical protein